MPLSLRANSNKSPISKKPFCVANSRDANCQSCLGNSTCISRSEYAVMTFLAHFAQRMC